MRILLTTLNAKYIHTALALHSLKAYAGGHGFNVDVKEFTINQDLSWILKKIVQDDPEVVGFSCNIWNIDPTKQLIRRLKKIRPGLLILAGGPEFSCDPRGFLADCGADAGIVGEGEIPFLRFLQCGGESGSWPEIPGFVWRDSENGRIHEQPLGNAVSLDELPFPYEQRVLEEPGRIIYYETSRGCPFSCTYCLSGSERGVRYRRLELVLEELDKLVAAGIRQVKLVDRTFNADQERCSLILRHIMDRHAGSGTNFHMEFVAELLDEPFLALLAQAPPGLFRAEVGIQSLHPPTLQAVRRRSDPGRLERNLQALLAPANIPIHLDLIAGLPFEGWEEFGWTFDWTYRFRPHEIQLGILKMLKGSELGRSGKEQGFAAADEAPYEILHTPWLSFEAVQRLKTVAHLVDLFYNTDHFIHAVPFLLGGEGRSAFQTLDRLAACWEEQGLDEHAPGIRLQLEFLRESAHELLPAEDSRRTFLELLRLDRALTDWGQESSGEWGSAPDLPDEWRRALTDEEWVGTFLPELTTLKANDRSRRVRRLPLDIDPRSPEEGYRATEAMLVRPMAGRTVYRIYNNQ